MPQRAPICALRASARRTSGKGSTGSAWPTPRTTDVNSGRLLNANGQRTNRDGTMTYGANVSDLATLYADRRAWQTPTQSPWKSARSVEAGLSYELGLMQQAEIMCGVKPSFMDNLSPEGWRRLGCPTTWPTPKASDGEGGRTTKTQGGGNSHLPIHVREATTWPTPTSALAKSGGSNCADKRQPENLASLVKTTWPTPGAAEGGGGKSTHPKSGGMSFATAVRAATWSTPRASDGEKGGPNMTFGAGGQPLPAQAAATWPTPSANEFEGGDPEKLLARRAQMAAKQGNNGFGLTLGQMATIEAAAWPTPTTSAQNCQSISAETRERPNGVCLADAARSTTWPTPTTRDGKDGTYCPNVPTNALLGRAAWSGDGEPTEKKGALNPEFVCWLMGFPIAWDACGATVTRSFRRLRRK